MYLISASHTFNQRSTEGKNLNEEFKQELSEKELVDRYSAMIYRLAYVRLQNVHDAEDITQEVLIKYIRRGKIFSDEEHRKAWLLKVAINTIKSFATSAWKRKTVPLEEAAQAEYDFNSENEQSSDIAEAVSTLPDTYRIVIHLFYYENMSVKNIASITNSAEGTVKSRLSRARVMLKEMLEEEYSDV